MKTRTCCPAAALAAVLLIGAPLEPASWVRLGPFGGAASVVVNDPHSLKTFVAGTRSALLFRTSDAGDTWTPLPFPSQLTATLNSLAIDPETPGVYLAGLSSDVPRYAGLLRSTDAGATWRRVAGLQDEQVRTIVFRRTNRGVVAAGTDSGVFLSHDSGATWRRISPITNSQLRPIVSLAFDPVNTLVLYAGTPHLPWKTSDAGAFWYPAPVGMLDDSDVFSIQVDRNQAQRVFAGACSGIYRSLNSGADWTRMARSKGGSDRTYFVIQDPQFEKVWFAGTTNGLVRSLDGGTTWEPLAPFTTRSLAFDLGRLGRILIATDQAGLLRSEDSGKTWQPVNSGFCNRRMLSLWTTDSGVYTALPTSAETVRVLHLSQETGDWDEVAPSEVPDTLRKSAALPSETLSANAADRASFHPCSPSQCGDVYDVVSVSGRLLAATSAGLMQSEDFGIVWRPVKGGLEADSIQAICIHPLRPEILFAAKYGVIYRSTDAGRSWSKLAEQPGPLNSIRKLVIAAGRQDRIFVLTGQEGIWMLPLDNGAPSKASDDSLARIK